MWIIFWKIGNLLIWMNFVHTVSSQLHAGYPCPYGTHDSNCKYIPAPHGQTPSCARPGMTYCEETPHYPKYLIKSLLDKWCYDFNTLLLNESPIDFNGNPVPVSAKPNYVVPNSLYGPPNHVPPQIINQYHPPEPIHIPKPPYVPYVTNEIGNGYLPPPANYTPAYKGYFQQQPSYDYTSYTNNLSRQYYNQLPYSPFNNQPINSESFQPNFWSRLSNHRIRRSAFKEKIRSKFVPKLHTFKEFINHKPPRKVLDTTSLQKSQFLSIVEDVTQRTRSKRQAPLFELCTSRSQFVSPQAALNNQGNWKYVVNLGDEAPQYRQLVQSVVCTSTRCSSICRLPTGYTSRCEQRYVQRRLVALEESGQRLESDLFWLPSCCVCTIDSN